MLVTSPSRRLLALDVLRGIAILGTLASNIWIFTGATESGFSAWLPNGKFLGLLTIMFGIGLEIQRQSALKAGKKWPGKYPWRAGLLFLDGLLNYVFVVSFDVLRAYAVTGLLVAFLLLSSEKVQAWLIGVFLTAHVAFMSWQGFRIRPDVMDRAADVVLDGEPAPDYWSTVVGNIQSIPDMFGVGSEPLTILLMGTGLFLIGAMLYRNGVFTAERRRLRYWLIGVGLGVALPLDYVLAQTQLVPELNGLSRYGTAAIVALGLLALVAEWYVRRDAVGAPGRLLSCVGRMALSCYLLQNIIGVLGQNLLFQTALFQGMGNLLGTYVAFAGISALLIVFSWAWLRRFERGPFEMLWNWSYRKVARE